MSTFEIILLGIGLAMDAMTVSLCAGVSGHAISWRASLRMALLFGLFQAVMPVIGWLAGVTIAPFVSVVDHWIAFGLLAFVGIRMIRSGRSTDPNSSSCDPTRGSTLVMLSFATSIDALAVGFSLALLTVSVWVPALWIGAITFLLSLLAARLGLRLSLKFGKIMEILGGFVLIIIGLQILLAHLLSH